MRVQRARRSGGRRKALSHRDAVVAIADQPVEPAKLVARRLQPRGDEPDLVDQIAGCEFAVHFSPEENIAQSQG